MKDASEFDKCSQLYRSFVKIHGKKGLYDPVPADPSDADAVAAAKAGVEAAGTLSIEKHTSGQWQLVLTLDEDKKWDNLAPNFQKADVFDEFTIAPVAPEQDAVNTPRHT